MSALSGGFDDFEVFIGTDRGDQVYPVTVLKSPAGQADGKFVLPMSGQELEAAIGRMQALASDEAMLTDFGTRLFSALFQGDVLSRYAESVGMTRERKGLRIRLRVAPPGLAALPWELLYDPEKHEFLALSKRALITRYLHVARPPSPLRTELPLRILVAIASPQGLPRLDSETEVARIEKALALPLEHNLVQFDVLRNSTARALRDALLNPYHILHFIGHGDFYEGVGHLAFEDQQGDTDPVSGCTLGTLLKNTPVRLVVLNVCQSAQNIQTVRAFTGAGPALVEAGVPAVVAMQFAVGDDSALVFTEDFYGMLSRYLPVDECIILMDGLNHIPGDETQRAHGIAVVRRFLKEYPQHKYVITCRTLVYEDEAQEWKGWIILPHSDEDVRAYLIRRLGEARGKQLYQSLPDPMRELARTPLLLSLLLEELCDLGDEAAKRRALLFAHFASRILSEKKGVIPVESQKELLARLAYTMKRDQIEEYSLAGTLTLIANEAREAWPEGVTPQDTLDDLLASGLLRTGSTARIAFAHSYCQDYFAALALQEEFANGRVDWESLIPEHRWRETILLLVSMVEQPAALIRQLLAYDPLQAAECLLEVGAVNSGLPGQIGEALAEREKVGTEREKTRAAKLLAELGAAGIVSEAVGYRQGVEAGVDKTGEGTTAITYPVRRGQLVVTRGSLAGLCIPLLDGTACLGRSSHADITVSERSVSRRHAEIRVTEEEISIRDLGSTNGTRVNGQQATAWRQLQDGDEIQLGELPLMVRISKN